MLEAVGIGKAVDGFMLVEDISLTVARGEVVGILGPGGAGKTSTFRLLVGIDRPDAGEIRLDGVDVTALPVHERARRGLGYLPQEPSLIGRLTVADNLRIALEVHDLDRGERETALAALLRLVGLEALRQQPAARLSGGERRRCEIARTLAANPGIILLDEPFAGIDPIAVESLRAAIRLMATLGLGVLITDHHARELLGVVDRAYVIHNGRIFMAGPPAAIIADPGVREVYLGATYSAEGTDGSGGTSSILPGRDSQ